jgi:hypothetical protein
MEQLSPLKILQLSSLPSASANAGALVQVSGVLYWSDGTNWLQVAPSSGGGTVYDNSDPSSSFCLLDDFISSGTSNYGIYGPLGLEVEVSGTSAAVSAIPGGQYSPGVMQAATGTTATGRAGWYTATSFPLNFGQFNGIGGAYNLKFRIKTDTTLSDGTNSYSLLMGFTNAAGSNTPSNGLFVYYDQSTTTWRFRARNAGTQTEADSNVTVAANTWYTVEIAVSNAATPTATCRIRGSNSTDSGTLNINTNVPTGQIGLGFQILKSAGTASRLFIIDYVRLIGVFSTPRP